MTKILRQLFLATSLAVSICSCSSAADKNPTAARKGAQQAMKTYYMGRFAINVPAQFKLAVQSHRFRLVEIEEYDNTQDAKQKWLEHLAKVEKLQKPRGISKIVISFVDEKAKGLRPQCKVDFDEGFFDSAHEPIYSTKSAQFITFAAIENICRREIRRKLEKGGVDGPD